MTKRVNNWLEEGMETQVNGIKRLAVNVRLVRVQYVKTFLRIFMQINSS